MRRDHNNTISPEAPFNTEADCVAGSMTRKLPEAVPRAVPRAVPALSHVRDNANRAQDGEGARNNPIGHAGHHVATRCSMRCSRGTGGETVKWV